MPTQRRPGMDHDHYPWLPIVKRTPLVWPNGARLALGVVVTLERMEWAPPAGSFQSPAQFSHLAMQRPILETWNISHRDYGHRIGIFRVLDVLARHGIRPTIAIDAVSAENYPYLVRHLAERKCEFIGHGWSASRIITSRMSEDEERACIRDSLAAVTKATGARPAGWLGPEYGESTRTPGLLAEAGVRYVCDWVNDEQPYPMTTPKGELYALPVMLELGDLFSLRDRRFPVDAYARHLKDGFETVYGDARLGGRSLVINLHPWLIGQPCRIGFLDEALAHMVRRQGVWCASGSEIIDAYRHATSAK